MYSKQQSNSKQSNKALIIHNHNNVDILNLNNLIII